MPVKEGSKTRAHIQYKLQDGTLVPGVTTIIGSVLAKPALIHWAWNLGRQNIDYRKFRDDKADIGTLAHSMIMAHLKGEEPETDDYSKQQIDQAENCVLSYFNWEKDHPFKPILVEHPLVSEKHGFGGTIDCLARLNGRTSLVDYKTGKAIYDDYMFQLAAYKLLLEENKHKIDEARILNIGRSEDEEFLDKLAGDLQFEKGIFLNCLSIYQLRRKMKAR